MGGSKIILPWASLYISLLWLLLECVTIYIMATLLQIQDATCLSIILKRQIKKFPLLFLIFFLQPLTPEYNFLQAIYATLPVFCILVLRPDIWWPRYSWSARRSTAISTIQLSNTESNTSEGKKIKYIYFPFLKLGGKNMIKGNRKVGKKKKRGKGEKKKRKNQGNNCLFGVMFFFIF